MFRISQLTAEVLPAADDDVNDFFLTSEDDKDELEVNELALCSMFKQHVVHLCEQGLLNCIP